MSDVLVVENRHSGERLEMRRAVLPDGSECIEIEGSLPPGAEGPPPHVHPLQDEVGVVVSGTLALRLGKQTMTHTAGEEIRIPAGTVHSWCNGGQDLLRFRGRISPALRLDAFLKEVTDSANAGSSARPSLFDMAYLLEKYKGEIHLASIPRGVQALLFPVLRALGGVLGKYRKYQPKNATTIMPA